MLLILSRTFSTFGISMYLMVLPLIVLDVSGSLREVSFFFAISKIPSILLTPLLGILVDRSQKELACNSLVWQVGIHFQRIHKHLDGPKI